MKHVIFKALVRNDGSMVAALASIPEGEARFFIMQKRESQDDFIGRISGWVKDRGGQGLDIQQPDVLPSGVDEGEVLMRLRHSFGATKEERDASEFNVKNTEVIFKADKPDLPH